MNTGIRNGAAYGIATVAAMMAVSAAAGQEAEAPLVISADRPGFSETTGIVPSLHLQVESGWLYTYRDRGGVQSERNAIPELLVRIGLIDDRLEFRASTNGYIWTTVEDAAGRASDEGWSDVALGMKLKVCDQAGAVPRIAVDATATVGAGTDGISSEIAEPVVKFLWSYDLSKCLGEGWTGATLGGNANIAWPTANGDHFAQGQFSAFISFTPIERTSVFVEYFALAPSAPGEPTAHYIDFGGAWLVTDRVQLDARVGFGLNRSADNVFVGVGLSVLF